MSEEPQGSLAGLKVVDLSRVLAGPLCAQMLGDHGADVIKVEPPGGDETRAWGPPFTDDGTSAYFTNLNRNKRNVVLDLRTEAGRDVLRRLLAEADVLVENYKAGTLARWGLGEDWFATHCPRLVHAQITGFGAEGPMGGAPGYDAVLQAYGGLMSINGERDGAPLRMGVPIVDMVTGLLTFSGVMLALHERAASGRGQLVDCSLLDAALTILHPHSGSWLADGRVPERSGSAHPTISPYDTFECANGPVFLAVGNDGQFRELAGVLGAAWLSADERFATNPGRVVNRDALRGELEGRLRTWDKESLGRDLLDRGVPCSPVHDVAETMTDPQVLARDLVVRLADGYAGVGLPVKMGRTPGGVRSSPRAQGQDTREVLRELGLDDDVVAAVEGHLPG